MRPRVLVMAVGAVLAVGSAARAQDAAQKPVSSEAKRKAASSTRKVWTDDNVTPSRPVANVTVLRKESRAAEQVASPAAAKEETAPKLARTGAAPALSNPKTLDEADKMIAWENRDIEAQQEFVNRLQQELRQAPVDQRERLQKLLQERIQILADLRQEQQALVAQRKDLEKGTR